MEIILLERIENIGGIGDRVKVKSGYARNFLIPKGKATLATAENIAHFEKIRADLEAKAAEELGAAQARAAKLEGQELRITVQAGREGRMFGSVGTVDIADACAHFGADVERSEVRLPEGPLRVVGEHTVEIHLHSDVNVPLRVILESSEPLDETLLAAGSDEAGEESLATGAAATEAQAAAAGDDGGDEDDGKPE
jgi:large subunit ribosomal protein L9